VPVLPLADYDFTLPDALIAQSPARPREAARLLEVPRAGPFDDRNVRDLPALLEPGDVLVVNDTRVIPARLRARRAARPDAHAGDAAIELLLNRAEPDGTWLALARNAKRLRPGDTLAVDGAPALTPRVVARDGDTVRLDFGADPAALLAALEAAGEVPLPPYIARPDGPTEADRADYQTVFARTPGAVAAPTASLHFTPALLDALAARGVRLATVTLHVGAGTFLPVRGDDFGQHRLHAEWGEVTEDAAAMINAARRIVAVGTTALRLLETVATGERAVAPWRGLTDLYLLPGYRFRTADLLLTNFHLPRSTLFALVCAFAGTDRMRAAYAHAIAERYRFYSYGDASLLERAP